MTDSNLCPRCVALQAERDAMERKLDLRLDEYAKDADIAAWKARAEKAEARLKEIGLEPDRIIPL